MVTCNVIDSHDWLIMDTDTLNTSLYASGSIIIPYRGHKYILFTQHPLAAKTYDIPGSKRTFLSAETIKRWYHDWKRGYTILRFLASDVSI